MKIRYRDGEWWKFADDGEGINPVKIIDIDNRPLTDEILEELGFYYIQKDDEPNYDQIWFYNIGDKKGTFTLFQNSNPDGSFNGIFTTDLIDCYHDAEYKTVGSIKLLLEALKGDL